jgi:riboflavin kinase/FMN adenylyltransferase
LCDAVAVTGTLGRMNVAYEGEALDLSDGSVVTVGTFDGVHVGHRAVISEVRRLAEELGGRSIVGVFDRHPATIVRPETAPRLLTDLHERIELLGETGVDTCYVVRFDEERSLQTPAEFVQEVVVEELKARAMVVGEDFHFGHRRRGDTAVLTEMQATYGFKIVGMSLVGIPGRPGPVSSTAIREALAAADIPSATGMLGRSYEIRGVVEHGDHRGRTIGFPTANVAVPGDIMLPSDGVYAGWYERANGEIHRAAINLGRRPTFYDETGLRLLEAHLLDFDGDLYEEHARVRFTTFLRGEVKFSGIDTLVTQLRKDVEAARQALAA